MKTLKNLKSCKVKIKKISSFKAFRKLMKGKLQRTMTKVQARLAQIKKKMR